MQRRTDWQLIVCHEPPMWCAQDWVTPNVGVHLSAYDAFAEEEEKFHLVVKCGTSPGSALALLLNLVQHEGIHERCKGSSIRRWPASLPSLSVG